MIYVEGKNYIFSDNSLPLNAYSVFARSRDYIA